MKNLLVGMIAGTAVGFALGSSPCAKKVIRSVQNKMEDACDCAEREVNKMRQDLADVIQPDAQP